MNKVITSFVGLDVHKDSTAITAAKAGRESPQFIGTVGADLAPLLKALKSFGQPETMLVVYEAGPCGYGLARQLRISPATHSSSIVRGLPGRSSS